MVQKAAALAFIVLLPVVLLLTDVQITAFDRNYYTAEYIKYNIPQSLGMELAELDQATDKMLQYLENKRKDLDFKAVIKGQQEEFFSPRDKQHMVDVKNLFVGGRHLRDAALVYLVVFVIYLLRKKSSIGLGKLAGYGLAAGCVGFIPIFILIILMNIDFYKYFTIFHLIFFNNDLWLLDPAQDRLINMYPQDIFTDMAFRISYFYIAELIAILAVCMIYKYFYSRNRSKPDEKRV